MAAGESPVKQAVKWVDEQLREHPGGNRVKLVGDACRRFDLSPLEEDFLVRLLTGRSGPGRA
jgi:hypothetical protein